MGPGKLEGTDSGMDKEDMVEVEDTDKADQEIECLDMALAEAYSKSLSPSQNRLLESRQNIPDLARGHQCQDKAHIRPAADLRDTASSQSHRVGAAQK